MPYVTTEAEIDLEVDEFWEMCSSREKMDLVDMIIEDGYAAQLEESGKQSINEHEWSIVCDKLKRNRLSLTVEQEEMIKKLVENFV